MPKSDNQKLKVLYILDYLEQNSSEEHPVGAPELIRMLQDRSIKCERKTIYSDVEALRDYGADILSVPGKEGGYYIASRNFELPELKLLIDAVQSSRFLTEKKSRELIKKLCRECNRHDGNLMNRGVFIESRVKSMNETIYYTVDSIQEAIYRNTKITFRYFDYGMDRQRHYREKDYVASPYGLCQDNGNYYLLAHSDRHGPTHYRVDRMSDIAVLPDQRTPCPELTGDALTEYVKKHFQMYSGDTVSVRLRFHKELVNVVIDRFGLDTMMIPDGDDHFIITVQIVVSPMFLSWVIGFGAKARILSPQSVIDQCKDLCAQAAADY